MTDYLKSEKIWLDSSVEKEVFRIMDEYAKSKLLKQETVTDETVTSLIKHIDFGLYYILKEWAGLGDIETEHITNLRNELKQLRDKIQPTPNDSELIDEIVDGSVRLIYESGQPKGIRDDGGYLSFFTKVRKYQGQEERYQNELETQRKLADYLVRSLTQFRTN